MYILDKREYKVYTSEKFIERAKELYNNTTSLINAMLGFTSEPYDVQTSINYLTENYTYLNLNGIKPKTKLFVDVELVK